MNLLYERIGGHEGISRPLRDFYADVHQDQLIGPIFNAKIKDWNHHWEIITSFWETLIGGPSIYARPMPMKHLPLGLRTEDFERWLFLWQANCRAQLPRDVAKEMIDLADHIGHNFACDRDLEAVCGRIASYHQLGWIIEFRAQRRLSRMLSRFKAI